MIGLLCMNFYINTPLSRLLKSLDGGTARRSAPMAEHFAENSRDLIHQSTARIRAGVEADATVLPSNRNREVIARLYHENIFGLKDAVPAVAQELKLSPNTVYLHLRNIRRKAEKA